jgi:hypothetical protein
MGRGFWNMREDSLRQLATHCIAAALLLAHEGDWSARGTAGEVGGERERFDRVAAKAEKGRRRGSY